MGNLWSAEIGHSPLDVVAWHGNYAPYKYDLRRFNAMGSTSYDHPDPSIFLVLQAPSDTPGIDTLDFVIFPPRWVVMEHTFRPPWFHRNVASEFMGLIHGAYDAKAEGFVPGGASLHNCMIGHGPDAETFAKASAADTSVGTRVTDSMAFMFETRRVIQPTRYALDSAQLQDDYYRCWARPAEAISILGRARGDVAAPEHCGGARSTAATLADECARRAYSGYWRTVFCATTVGASAAICSG